jgi:manganese-transporting P-type ATPase
MWYGLLGVSFVAFSCATEFIPELNTQLRLVPFTTEFKTTLTGLMLFDYCGCWVVEQVFKRLFSDFRPKDIAIRRRDQLEREVERKKVEKALEEAKQEREQQEKDEAILAAARARRLG